MKWINKIFGKKSKESRVADGFFTTKEVMVDSELAFRPSTVKEIEKVKRKILVSADDFNNLKFDDDLDLHDYNLKILSNEAKLKIIEIIKEDSKKRVYGNQEKIKDGVGKMEFQHLDENTKGETDTKFVSVKDEIK